MCLGRELACIYATITPSSVDSLFPIFFISVYLPSIHTNLHLFILFIQHFVHVLIYFHHVGIMHAFESMLHNRVLFMHHCWYWMAYNMYTHALFSEGRMDHVVLLGTFDLEGNRLRSDRNIRPNQYTFKKLVTTLAVP